MFWLFPLNFINGYFLFYSPALLSLLLLCSINSLLLAKPHWRSNKLGFNLIYIDLKFVKQYGCNNTDCFPNCK